MRSIRVHYVLAALPALGAGIINRVGAQSPTQQTDTLKFTAVSATGQHTCALTRGGTAYCWGLNGEGQLGDGSTVNRSRPRPVVVSGGVSFVGLFVGLNHTCGVTGAGAAYCWGENHYAQLGNGDTINQAIPVLVAGNVRFAAVSAGFGHTCGFTADSVAYCWGHNRFGQLGDSTMIDRTSPTHVSGGVHFTALSTGGFHTCGVTTAGAAYCWGANPDGQLGDGTTTRESSPVPVAGSMSFRAVSAGLRHTCGVTATGVAYCWGLNDRGQLGDGSTVNRSSPVRVSSDVSYIAVTAGRNHTCGITAAGAAYCWGGNSAGQLGDASKTDRQKPVVVANRVPFVTLSAGDAHTCGVTATGAAYCWGLNDRGQLGDGALNDQRTPVSVSRAPDIGNEPTPPASTRSNVPAGNPLDQLAGAWGLRAFVTGAGQFAGPTCGKGHVPGGAPVTLASPRDGAISISVSCDNGSEYAFRIRYDSTTQSYLLTARSRPGISVQDFPVTYTDGEGWQGKRDQLVDDATQSVTAMVARIDGRLWTGWMIAVLPTAGIKHEDDLKQPYFRVDLTRAK